MTIDVLSRAGEVPIVIGDEADMAEILAVGTDEQGEAHLVMRRGRDARQKVALSREASRNFAHADHVLLIKLTRDDRVASACRIEVNGTSGEMEALEQHEIEELTMTWRPGSKR